MAGPIVSQASLNTGIAWVELVLGALYFRWGLRSKETAARLFGPIGLWWIVSGAFRFLSGRLPEMPWLALFVFSFLLVGVWFVRALRASKAERSADDRRDPRVHG